MDYLIKNRMYEIAWCPEDVSWAELNKCVEEYSCWKYVDDLLTFFEENPITTETIDNLIEQGWKAFLGMPISQTGIALITEIYRKKGATIKEVVKYLNRSISRRRGFCDWNEKEIILGNIRNFERDITLFHEIIHAVYRLEDNITAAYAKFNTLLIEWLSRKLRADPMLLRHTICRFGLEPQIYDRASLIAFTYPPEQLVLPFAEEYINKFETQLEPQVQH